MLSATSELAIRTLVFLAMSGKEVPIPAPRIARALKCSPSYLAKTTATLSRAGILRSVRGTRGGVVLSRRPDEITLLAVVEACQGALVDLCRREFETLPASSPSIRLALGELEAGTTAILSRWTLSRLLATEWEAAASFGPRRRSRRKAE
jgi:Rrf2 family protein